MKKENNVFLTDFNAFKKQFDEIYPTMESYLEENNFISPSSAYEMLDLFIGRHHRGQLSLVTEKEKQSGRVDIFLKREDFIDFHNFINNKLKFHSQYREISKAISFALDRIEDKEVGAPVLKMYVECKLENPKRSKLNILNESVSLKYEVDQKSFYNWIDYLDDALKKLDAHPL